MLIKWYVPKFFGFGLYGCHCFLYYVSNFLFFSICSEEDNIPLSRLSTKNLLRDKEDSQTKETTQVDVPAENQNEKLDLYDKVSISYLFW